MNLEIIKSMLDKYGIDVVGCPNGEEGVKAFKASTEGEYYAVPLDLRMPAWMDMSPSPLMSASW